MANPIDFYFDFSSPYGYFAAERIDALAAKYRRDVVWRPILLGAVFKVSGGQPLPMLPMKGPYAKRDIERGARFYGVPFKWPSPFPIATQSPARAYYWQADRDSTRAKQLAHALFRAFFVDGIDIASPTATADVAARLGIDRTAVLAAIEDPAVKERLKRETQTAIERGVFGSPFIIIDGEPFWGFDRFDQVEHWLATGGW